GRPLADVRALSIGDAMLEALARVGLVRVGRDGLTGLRPLLLGEVVADPDRADPRRRGGIWAVERRHAQPRVARLTNASAELLVPLGSHAVGEDAVPQRRDRRCVVRDERKEVARVGVYSAPLAHGCVLHRERME